MDALEMMDMYYDRMRACSSTSGRNNNFKKMLALWKENETVRAVWTFVEDAYLIVNRFVKNVVNKVKAIFKPTSNVIYSCEKVEGNSLVYLLRLLDEEGNLVWSKVGTTTRTVEERMKEHLTYYRKHGIKSIEVTKVWNCGEIDAEGLESFLRSKYIRKHPHTFYKNDRFAGIEFDIKEAEKWTESYLND